MESLEFRLFSKIISKIPIKTRLQILFFRKFKRFINFDNPRTYNEKIQCKKIADRNELLTIGADKIKAKDFVKDIVPELYLPKMLWVGDSPESLDKLDLTTLPKDYVYKANHTSQTIEIIRHGNHLSKDKMKSLAKDWLKKDQSGALGEWAYENIPPRVFIEEYLEFNGHEPDDYKLYVFNGKVGFIQLDSGRFTSMTRNLYDANWEELGFEYHHPRRHPAPPKPEFIDEMICIAEKIGQHYDFVRVDLYFYEGKVTFSELTMYSASGFLTMPDDWDVKIGDLWTQNYKVK
ncbi:ATP-grasp fold amidoligase family protein [Photobacterium aquimaris]|uniref:Uncharacterized protein n=1 Tax=Photobacterium aquimaris TaxID=512643 RepID=A0A2T3I2J2_9GAMM|nr:ATP-grasp fold amidoligase family protein [Photobacterium aquimaris]MCP4956117.1 hypothetical protein [Photobacterium aquimaris]OBU24331.1 hypothetical protein AYY21_02135 [Photobacterium aquimaris]PQJ40480.1 hypothetical protein BTN98_02050 [Photobacterium aquimaris]PSU12453.1 hypothetical protein C0W81_00735 [Photobacterium aquimaris]